MMRRPLFTILGFEWSAIDIAVAFAEFCVGVFLIAVFIAALTEGTAPPPSPTLAHEEPIR
ncbi:MAG TPA: hypothetical protein VIM56_06350 [Rhizomicrobium sp.]